MADIELVIKISDENYKWVCDHVNMGYDLFKMIANGTPLPEGHGRLIDADELIRQYNLDEATKYGNKNAKQQAHSYSTMMLYEIADMIDDAPTIIEADKGDKEC